MDGTLLDTERLARACFVQACAAVDFSADMGVYDRCVGASWEATQHIMRAGFGDEFPYQQMSKHWSRLYHDHVFHHPVDIKDGIEALLAKLAALQVPLAVATSSRRAVVERKLELAGIRHLFAHMVCGGETAQGKPAADPYLAALEGLGLQARSCWAVEDSDNGVRAAVAAGMIVFQIPDELQPRPEVLALNHEVLPSAAELLPRLE